MLAAPLAATEVYRWVDENGVVHFSDTRPAASGKPVETVTVDGSQPADYDPEQDLFNVAQQQEVMQARREQLAQQREERAEARRQSERRQASTPVAVDGPSRSWNTGFWWPPYNDGPNRPPGQRPPGKPPQRPQPPIEIEPAPPASQPFRPPGSGNN